MDSLQRKYDRLLIKGWYEFKNISWLYYNFFQEPDDNVLNKNNMFINEEVIKFFVDNEMKRVFIFSKNDYHVLPKYNSEIRSVINKYSHKLSTALFSKYTNRIDIFLNIDNYKWTNIKSSKEYKSKKKRFKRKTNKADVFISRRELSPSWNHSK